MQKIISFFNQNLVQLPLFVFGLIGVVQAHNKVVVIPIAGDDVLTEINPSMPIAKADTSENDYLIETLTVIDKITKIEWQRAQSDDQLAWNNALDSCSNLGLNENFDWRVPSIVELMSIVDYGAAVSPFIDQDTFPTTIASSYWSSSGRSALPIQTWGISFLTGANTRQSKTTNNYVRCVR